MNIKLKPCPFCGGKAIFETYSTIHSSFYGPGYEFRIKCSKCGMYSGKDKHMVTMYLNEDGTTGYRIDSREEAAQEWNKRYDAKGE